MLKACMNAINQRESYRHGNVRSEAVRIGLELVRESGHPSLSMRQVAQQIGVAHRSLYNHFTDREALIDAIAEDGLIELAKKLQLCRTRFDYVRTELEFAFEDPFLYDLVQSRPHATMKQKPSLRVAVRMCISEAQRLFSEEGRTSDENRRAVMKVLMLLHGGIMLYRGGILDVADDAAMIAELQAMIASNE